MSNTKHYPTHPGAEHPPIMKCDELKYETLGDMMPFYPRSTLVIRKQFVDAAIAELKDENRRLKRALYIAHEYKARFKRWWLHLALDCEAREIRPDTKTINRISRKIENCEKSERKCRAKAEEYK